MKMRKLILFTLPFVAIVLSLPLIFASCATVGIEKVQYDVVDKSNPIEIRQYKSYLVAETLVDSDFKEAGNAAFRRLFNYISGDNQAKESIAMTAPVNQQAQSEKIAMTAPVTQQASGDKYAVSFVMPAKYTLETLPKPTDPAVTVKEIPGYKAAVIRYSGTWSTKRYEAKKAQLETYMKENGLSAVGEPIWARYDPPFQLWFLRRNEVVIPIE
ncbi:MAG: SOUL family heme-binding protein [Planctomycetota bacterium]|jgi:effector-binding domain-containing protein